MWHMYTLRWPLPLKVSLITFMAPNSIQNSNVFDWESVKMFLYANSSYADQQWKVKNKTRKNNLWFQSVETLVTQSIARGNNPVIFFQSVTKALEE